MATKVEVLKRPYHLTFKETGATYPLTSEDARRLIAEYPVISATRNRVVLRGEGETTAIITAATLGGGPAFDVRRSA